MKPSMIANALKRVVSVKQPVFIWGPPGVGKSQIVKKVSEDMNLKMIDIRAVLLDPVDLRGIPKIDDGFAKWCPPSFLPREGNGILFLDEMNAAPALVQAACYQLILDRKLGEYTLPDGWSIIAAGNREKDRAVVSRMPTALANRFVHLEFDVDLNDWIVWANKNGIKNEIISFLRFRPKLLHDFDPQKNDKAFPSPRSWEFISKLVSFDIENDVLENALIQGTIGVGAGMEFISYLKILKQTPNVDHIFQAPESFPVPTETSMLYAICGAISQRANKDVADAIVTFARRLPIEYSVILIRDCIQRSTDFIMSNSVAKWIEENKSIIL